MNKDIEYIARQYVGVPFKHQGRTIHGLDCVGLIIRIAHDLGISDFDYLNYGRDPKPEVMRKYLRSLLDRVGIAKQEPGDILYMSFLKHPQHLAIYTSNDTIIHAAYIFKKVVEQRFDTYWKQRVTEVYRYRSITWDLLVE